jgi:hypothetical protein
MTKSEGERLVVAFATHTTHRANATLVVRLISSFVLRHSFVLGYFVLRHSSR